MPTHLRSIARAISGHPVTEGAGVAVSRLIGSPTLEYLDPFLLLDEFGSSDPADYMAGFPSHPHRGFETVTYMLAGRSRHRDSTGSEGVLEAGDVQWMTAGRGILHSEMPELVAQRLWGLQLWVNLPREFKLTAPRYQDIPSAEIPEIERPGARIRILAGELDGVQGAAETHTDVRYFDIALDAGAELTLPLESSLNVFLFPYQGAPDIISDERSAAAEERALAILGAGEQLSLRAATDCRLLLVAGEPINEPIARGGPFVMNSEAEIRQAFHDYQRGTFGNMQE